MIISYITDRGVAEWVKIDTAMEQDSIILQINRKIDGAVVLGKTVFPLKDGEARIPMNSLANGEYAPKFETDSGVYNAERFTKQGRNITLAKADDSLIRRILVRGANLESRILALEKAVTHLENLCKGHDIFNFERKEQ